MAKTDHLQCGCKRVDQPNASLGHGDTNTKGEKCECTIQGKKGFKNTKKGKIKVLKFGSMFMGRDAAIE